MDTEKYKGKVVHKVTKKRGYKFIAVAKQMGISRATLYKNLKKSHLTDRFLIKVGDIIHYDFAKKFPNLKNSLLYKSHHEHTLTNQGKKIEALCNLYKKYTMLLEESNKLTKFLVRILNNTQVASIKRIIDMFIRKNIKPTPKHKKKG
ncbi:MAG: hypothetical protein AAF900_00010 [Bacteroidota bacterium]